MNKLENIIAKQLYCEIKNILISKKILAFNVRQFSNKAQQILQEEYDVKYNQLSQQQKQQFDQNLNGYLDQVEDNIRRITDNSQYQDWLCRLVKTNKLDLQQLYYDQYLWKLLLKSDDIYNACFILKRGDITQKTMDFALTWFFKNDQDQPIKELLKDKKIKEIDKNQIDLLMNFESYKVLALLINNNFINIIQNQNILNAFYTQPRAVHGLTQLIENDVIKWNDGLLQLFVKTEKFFLLVRLIKDKKIQFSYKILDVLIENNRALQLRDILLTNRFIYGCQAIINFLIDHNYLAVLNNIYDHFHLDSDAQLFQNIFVEKDSLNNLKYLLFNREVKLNNNTLDYLIKNGEDLFVYNNILMFQDIEERIEDVNHFVQLLKQYKKSDALYSCIRNNNLDCTNDIIQFFINQKKQLIIYNLIEKKEIQVNQTLLKKFVDKQLLNLLVKLFFQHIIYADKEKDVLEYLINNKNKLSPMTKLKFEQFLRSEELDY